MRRDAIGLWWNDAPVPRPPKADAVKRTPPPRTWEAPDYLPGLQEALAFPVPYLTDHELMYELGGRFLFDIECYVNFFQVAFVSLKTGKVIDFIMTPDYALDIQRIMYIVENCTIVGFNSYSYDIPMLSFACAGHTNETLKQISDAIIKYDENASDIMRSWKIKRLKADHIDLIEVCPLRGGLKIYGGRIHVPKMQDLPFPEKTILSPSQMAIVRWYCVNDLTTTAFVHETLSEQLTLRYSLSNEHGIDLRSKSDAQIAEAVIASELTRITHRRPQKPQIDIGTVYYYRVPAYLSFRGKELQDVLELVRSTMFVVDEGGSIGLPKELSGRDVHIGRATYRMGIGGLHSQEKTIAHRAVGDYRLFDVDVESYYPRIMLNLGLYPQHLGPAFLDVFGAITERRLAAKRAGDKVVADSLKITINGSYGKLGSQYSILYAPDLLIQTTLTGQLALLMLIELLELYQIEVISANTDGIAMKCREAQVETMRTVVKYWESVTQFKTEETEYRGLYSKDVNNYIAVKKDGKTKTKGEYANPWADTKNIADRLKKNPTSQICVEAVEAFLVNQIPVENTIRACRDVTRFVSVRHVRGGAVKNGEYLGTSIRWYYSTEVTGEIIYARNGHVVPRSEKARPLMVLPQECPNDIDHDWYIERANRILKDIGFNA